MLDNSDIIIMIICILLSVFIFIFINRDKLNCKCEREKHILSKNDDIDITVLLEANNKYKDEITLL